jgi:3,4-dihydroxyphenylacetate 2,3-dioxygenase
MSAVQALLKGPAQVPFDIMRVSYCVLQVRDLDASLHFYDELLGLRCIAREDGVAYLKGWEERQHHSLVLRQADEPVVERLGFRVRTDHDLDLLAEWYEARDGNTVRMGDADLRGMSGRTLRVWDHLGTPLEYYVSMELQPTVLQDYHLHRGAPIMRFDHVNLHSARVEEAIVHWQELGFRCSEYISTDSEPERLTGAWLLRKPTVHDVALTAGRGPRLHHMAMWVADAVGVLRLCDQLGGAHWTHAIERGPGRHGVSNAFFVYLRDPDGHRLELYPSDYYTGDPDHEPLRWSVNDPRCRSFWGTRAPDSWYDESSLLLGPDGRPVPTEEATVDERDQHSEVMA